MVRVQIKEFNGMYVSEGVVIESNADRCCPKLKPGEVIEVDDDHKVVNHPCTEITNSEPTRPVRFGSPYEAAMSSTHRDEAKEIQRLQMQQGATEQKLEELEARKQQRVNAGLSETPSVPPLDPETAKLMQEGQGNPHNQHIREETDADPGGEPGRQRKRK